ncbi:hypothetical protein UFOVP371_58 [uncultured Caudovirales phage]|uniref:Uncharacterized protein n=1 Tax=uncultured Caudovirales phage TaxID=2100421 RepID=A0A6J7WYL8_9CAUD|nr:hypothetical protein UFOVP371_58 [uncultured Caudovirales phage]
MIDTRVPTISVVYRLLQYALIELNDNDIEEATGTLMQAIRMLENIENL